MYFTQPVPATPDAPPASNLSPVGEPALPPQKRARPAVEGPGRSVFLDRFHVTTAADGCVNSIAPRATQRRHKRRTASKGPWPSALRVLVPLLRPETQVSLLLAACERHQPTADGVKAQLTQEPRCRRVVIRNVPYSISALEMFTALEDTFGKVEKVAVTCKGIAVASFSRFESAFRAVFGPLPSESLNPSDHPALPTNQMTPQNELALRGRVLQFRFSHASDSVWDLFDGGGGPGSTVWPAAAVSSDIGMQLVNRNGQQKQQASSSLKRRRQDLIVRHLAPSTDEHALASAFAHFGDIKRVFIPVDAKGKTRGCGYVTFAQPDDALRAAQQTQRLINDRVAFVSLASEANHLLGSAVSRKHGRRRSYSAVEVSAGNPGIGQRRRGRTKGKRPGQQPQPSTLKPASTMKETLNVKD